MPSSWARVFTCLEMRPVIHAVRNGTGAHFSMKKPMRSRTCQNFISSPEFRMMMEPSVSTPSTSMARSFIFLARLINSAWEIIERTLRLNQPFVQQIFFVEDADGAAVFVGHGKIVDAVFAEEGGHVGGHVGQGN